MELVEQEVLSQRYLQKETKLGCCRGLESYTQIGFQRKTQHRIAGYEAVLHAVQERAGNVDIVARKYIKATSRSRLQAIATGHSDHLMAVYAGNMRRRC